MPGMVLALEPMINLGTGDVKVLADDWTVVTLDHKPSAHYEHTIAILPDWKVEVLTSWTYPA
jgi:methionyl aminopeptidase